jgi:processing peptidase subunit alpha
MMAQEKSVSPSTGPSTGGVGFFGQLFGKSSRVQVPLTDPLPGVDVSHQDVPAEAPRTEMSTLSNGVKVASENTPVRE